MSVEQIEEQIQHLAANDLARFTEWFGRFLAGRVSSLKPDAEPGWDESPEQVAELEKRLAEFKADPGMATPFEADYFDNLKRQLADERAKKASTR